MSRSDCEPSQQSATAEQVVQRIVLKDATAALIRTATQNDLEAILRLEEVFTPGQRWSAESWAEELDRHTMVVETEEVVAVATFSVIDRVADLNRIIVDPTRRRLGTADALLDRGLKLMSDLAAKTMLEVRSDNLGAIALYKRHGFQTIGLRPNYYLGADAQVMEVSHV